MLQIIPPLQSIKPEKSTCVSMFLTAWWAMASKLQSRLFPHELVSKSSYKRRRKLHLEATSHEQLIKMTSVPHHACSCASCTPLAHAYMHYVRERCLDHPCRTYRNCFFRKNWLPEKDR